MSSHQFPTKTQLLLPLLETLHEAGGRAKPTHVYDALAQKIGLANELRRKRGPAGKAGEINLWERQVRNSRQDAALRGLIENAQEKRTRNVWELTDKGRQGLHNCKPGLVITVFETDLGTAILAEAESAIGLIANNSVDLILTSPPYPLTTKKAYGNRDPGSHVDWLTKLAASWKEKLTDTGSLVLNLADVFQPGTPAVSLYQERLLIRLCDELGFTLAQKFYWENPSKLPSPAEWVCIRRIRVTPSIEQIYWLTKNASSAKANNIRILQPYSESMLRLITQGGQTSTDRKRPSGHLLKKGAFSANNGGSIPHNLLVASNTSSNDPYLTQCRALNIPVHPARFPKALPSYFIRFLTEPGDLVYDPLAGSGVTAEAAEELKRRWVISERSLTYLHGAATRFQHTTAFRSHF